MSNAIEKSTPRAMGEQIRQAVQDRKDHILRMLPEKVGKDRFMEIVLSVVSTPDIAACTPASIVSCVFACAKVGLMPDPVLSHIHIIPRNVNVGNKQNPRYEKQATILMGYKGFIELARRSGAVRAVHTEIVYRGDKFRYWIDEKGKHVLHEPNLEREIEDGPTCVYCIAEMTGDGQAQIEVLPWAKVLEVKEDTPAWNYSLIEMAKKTVIRRSSKLWPQSSDLANVVRWDEQYERQESQSLPELANGESVHVTVAPRNDNGNGYTKRSLLDIKNTVPTGEALDGGARATNASPQPERELKHAGADPIAEIVLGVRTQPSAPAPTKPAPETGPGAGADDGISELQAITDRSKANVAAKPADPRSNQDKADEYAQIDAKELRKQLSAAKVGGPRVKAWATKSCEKNGIAFLSDASDDQIRAAARDYMLLKLAN